MRIRRWGVWKRVCLEVARVCGPQTLLHSPIVAGSALPFHFAVSAQKALNYLSTHRGESLSFQTKFNRDGLTTRSQRAVLLAEVDLPGIGDFSSLTVWNGDLQAQLGIRHRDLTL
jgi:hypothetical protein